MPRCARLEKLRVGPIKFILHTRPAFDHRGSKYQEEEDQQGILENNLSWVTDFRTTPGLIFFYSHSGADSVTWRRNTDLP